MHSSFCLHLDSLFFSSLYSLLLPDFSPSHLFLMSSSFWTNTAPPKNIAFSSRPLQDEERLLLAYKVEKVFPLPQVAIYQSCPETRIESSIKKILIHESGCCNKGGAHTGHSSRHNNMDDTHFKDYSHSLASSPHEESFFTLQHVQYIDFSDVYLNYNKLNCEFREGEDVSISFTLQIKIPGTDFVVTRSILFYPGIDSSFIVFIFYSSSFIVFILDSYFFCLMPIDQFEEKRTLLTKLSPLLLPDFCRKTDLQGWSSWAVGSRKSRWFVSIIPFIIPFIILFIMVLQIWVTPWLFLLHYLPILFRSYSSYYNHSIISSSLKRARKESTEP